MSRRPDLGLSDLQSGPGPWLGQGALRTPLYQSRLVILLPPLARQFTPGGAPQAGQFFDRLPSAWAANIVG